MALTENSLYAVFSPADIRRYPWDDYAVAAQSPGHGHSGWDYVVRHISDREKYNRLVWEMSHDRQVDFRIHQVEIEKLLRDELIANVEDSDTARLDDLVNQAGEHRRIEFLSSLAKELAEQSVVAVGVGRRVNEIGEDL